MIIHSLDVALITRWLFFFHTLTQFLNTSTVSIVIDTCYQLSYYVHCLYCISSLNQNHWLLSCHIQCYIRCSTFDLFIAFKLELMHRSFWQHLQAGLVTCLVCSILWLELARTIIFTSYHSILFILLLLAFYINL